MAFPAATRQGKLYQTVSGQGSGALQASNDRFLSDRLLVAELSLSILLSQCRRTDHR